MRAIRNPLNRMSPLFRWQAVGSDPDRSAGRGL